MTHKIKTFKDWKSVIMDTLQGLGRHNATKLSGSLSYSTIFSLPPMLLLLTVIGGAVYGQDAVSGKIYMELKDLLGGDTAMQVQDLIIGLEKQENSGWAAVISSIALFVGSTGVFVEIQSSLNLIWGVKAKAKKSFIKLLLNRLMSISMILSLGFVLVVSLVVNTVVNVLGREILEYLPFIPVASISWFSQLLIFVILSLLFAFIFRFLPDVRLKWKDVLPGAMLTTLLFLLGKFIINFYISSNNTISLYGAASSIIILLVWVYFSALILYFGAEFTRARYEFKYDEVIPNHYAEYNEQRKWNRYLESRPIE